MIDIGELGNLLELHRPENILYICCFC